MIHRYVQLVSTCTTHIFHTCHEETAPELILLKFLTQFLNKIIETLTFKPSKPLQKVLVSQRSPERSSTQADLNNLTVELQSACSLFAKPKSH